MMFPACIHTVELRSFWQTIGAGFSYWVEDRRVPGVVLAENRADLEALLARILPGVKLDPIKYYSLGLFCSEIETPDAVHPDIRVIRDSMEQWWRMHGALYRMNGLKQSELADENCDPLEDDEAEDRRKRIRSWFPSLRPEVAQLGEALSP